MRVIGPTAERQVIRPDWPPLCTDRQEQIDIIEGVNDYGTNSMTLHTSAGCTMPVPGSNQAGYASELLNLDAFSQPFLVPL